MSDERQPELRLNNPLVVQWEYASEERLTKRNEAYRQLIEGVNAEQVAFAAVQEVAPARLLDVGCGHFVGGLVASSEASAPRIAATSAAGTSSMLAASSSTRPMPGPTPRIVRICPPRATDNVATA